MKNPRAFLHSKRRWQGGLKRDRLKLESEAKRSAGLGVNWKTTEVLGLISVITCLFGLETNHGVSWAGKPAQRGGM